MQLFFVISGFLITGLLLKEKVQQGTIFLRSFYWRRFIRIFPVFYTYIIIAYIINSLLDLQISGKTFLLSALYTQNFGFAGNSWLIAHSWSLAVEEQFYLLWPFLMKWNYKYAVIFIIFLFVYQPISQTMGYFHPESPWVLLQSIFGYFPAIMIGALVAIGLYKGWLNNYLTIFCHPFLILSFPLAWAMYLPTQFFRYGFFSVPFSYIFSSIFLGVFLLHVINLSNNSFLYKTLNTKAIKYFGTISYSIYIWQQIWIIPQSSYPGHNLWWTIYPYNIIGLFITAMLSFHLLERPLLKFKHII